MTYLGLFFLSLLLAEKRALRALAPAVARRCGR
jgi:hypothetical protein